MPKCKICGHSAKNLSRHIKAKHNISTAYYRAKFPGENIVDPELEAVLKDSFKHARERKVELGEAREDEEKLIQTLLKDGEAEKNRHYSKKALEDYRIFKQKYKDEYGFQESPELEELLFLLVTNRNLQKQYNLLMIQNASSTQASTHLKDIRYNTKMIQDLIIGIAEMQSSRDKTKDIVDLHSKTMKEADIYIKENLGEFMLRCPKCGQMMDTMGFPHPFFDKYTVFSKELWVLVLDNKIPIEYMAFALHTSIEGVLNTAKIRGDAVPSIDLLAAEGNLQGLMRGQMQS